MTLPPEVMPDKICSECGVTFDLHPLISPHCELVLQEARMEALESENASLREDVETWKAQAKEIALSNQEHIRENAKLREERDDYKNHFEAASAQVAELNRVFDISQSAVRELRAALEEADWYLKHAPSCQSMLYSSRPCDCGKDEAQDLVNKALTQKEEKE